MSKSEPVKNATSKTKINEIGGWRRSLFSPFRWATLKKAKWKTTGNTKSRESRISSYLNTEAPPTPEDVTLTTGTVKRKKKSFEIFHFRSTMSNAILYRGTLPERLRTLSIRTNCPTRQENGQRYLGPPIDWQGSPPPNAEVFITRMPNDCFEDEIYDFCAQAGTVYLLRLMINFESENRGFCFVTFSSPQEAAHAVTVLNQKPLRKGYYVRAEMSLNNCTLRIFGLDFDWGDEQLEQEIRENAKDVSEITIKRNTAHRTLMALLSFDTHQKAAIARRKLGQIANLRWGQNVKVFLWNKKLHNRGQNRHNGEDDSKNKRSHHRRAKVETQFELDEDKCDVNDSEIRGMDAHSPHSWSAGSVKARNTHVSSMVADDDADWKFILWSVLFVFGLCGTTIMWFTAIYQEEIFKTLTLGNGSRLHVAWKNPPLAPLLCVHIFNYTNVNEYFSDDNRDGKRFKLKVQDVGPYCFRETIERKYVTFRKNGTEMSYREQRLHSFDVENSVGSLNDTVLVPNVLILSVYKELRESSSFTRFLAYTALSTSGADPLIETTAQKYIFGYEDSIFSTIGSLHEVFSSDSKTLPKEFGVLKKRSGLSNDTVVVKTGIGNLDMMGQVIEVNNVTKFNAWSTDRCNLVTGSDGLFFRRSAVQTYQDVQLFHKDSCRGLPMYFDNVLELKGGIPAYRYKLRADVFDTNKTENHCYCNVSKSCHVRGVMDISPCASVQGAPIVISRPHFMDSNVNLDENGEEIIEGFQPDIDKHGFHVDIFPPIGLTVRTLMRMQLNVRIHNPTRDRNLNPLRDRMVLPMVWVEMNSGTEVPEKMYSLLYHLTYTMKWVEIALKWIFLLFTLFMAFVLYRMSFVKSSKNEFIVMWKKKPSPSIVSNVYSSNN